jgi:hypothetical protein
MSSDPGPATQANRSALVVFYCGPRMPIITRRPGFVSAHGPKEWDLTDVLELF